MTNPTDKEIAWQGRIQDKVGQATKAIVDRLVSMPKSGFGQLSPSERRDAHELIAKEIADVMYRLGTFVTAGAQDFQTCTLEQVTIKGTDKLKLSLVPVPSEGGPINLEQLAANSGKQVVLAFINAVAYQQAREALTKAIHREQTDWINREPVEEESAAQADEAQEKQQDANESTAGVLTGTANARVTTSTHAEGELIAGQPGETDAESQDQEQEHAVLQGASSGAGGSAGEGAQEPAGADGGSGGEPEEGSNPGNAVQPRPRGRGGRARGIQPTH